MTDSVYLHEHCLPLSANAICPPPFFFFPPPTALAGLAAAPCLLLCCPAPLNAGLSSKARFVRLLHPKPYQHETHHPCTDASVGAHLFSMHPLFISLSACFLKDSVQKHGPLFKWVLSISLIHGLYEGSTSNKPVALNWWRKYVLELFVL